mgnify:FL=1
MPAGLRHPMIDMMTARPRNTLAVMIGALIGGWFTHRCRQYWTGRRELRRCLVEDGVQDIEESKAGYQLEELEMFDDFWVFKLCGDDDDGEQTDYEGRYMTKMGVKMRISMMRKLSLLSNSSTTYQISKAVIRTAHEMFRMRIISNQHFNYIYY